MLARVGGCAFSNTAKRGVISPSFVPTLLSLGWLSVHFACFVLLVFFLSRYICLDCNRKSTVVFFAKEWMGGSGNGMNMVIFWSIPLFASILLLLLLLLARLAFGRNVFWLYREKTSLLLLSSCACFAFLSVFFMSWDGMWADLWLGGNQYASTV